jgi:hypothetical protein
MYGKRLFFEDLEVRDDPLVDLFLKIKMKFASYETLDFESWLHDLSILILWHIGGLPN